MKMKRLFKKSLISILILFILINFISATITNYSYGFFGEGLFTGLIGIITWIPRALGMACLTGLETLVSAFAKLGLGEIDGFGTIGTNVFVTPFHIFFNKIAILDVNFFNFDGVSGTVLTFRTAVAGWYYSIRLIACMILAVILIYIGIRMAISTIAQEKAMYKKMLVDWVTSLALLFLLHYIMLFTFACNEAIVNALEDICTELDLTSFMTDLSETALGLDTSAAMAAMMLYGIIIGQTISFLFAYVKRMLTVGFLIMIAPLITITYSIDKIGDGKAQALNTWLKEFVFTILIQPFHCILFASFASVAFDLIGVGGAATDSNIAEMILAVACIQFIKTGEQLVRKIFGFGEHGSGATLAAGTAIAMTALSKAGDAGKTVGSAFAKTRNFVAQNGNKLSKTTKGLTSKVNQLSKKVNDDGTLTKRGEKIAEKRAKKSAPQSGEFAAGSAGFEKLLQSERNNLISADAKNKAKKATKLTNKNAKLSTKAAEKKRKKDEKRESQIDKQLDKKYTKHQQEMMKQDPAKWEAERAKAGQELDQKAQARANKKKEIKGATDKYFRQNGQKIAANSLGAVTGLIGLGVNGMQGMVVGSKLGSGFINGYMTNTNKTLNTQTSEAAQPIVNLKGENDPTFDIGAFTYAVNAKSENRGFEKVEEQLKQILDKISGLSASTKTNMSADIRRQIATSPEELNTDFLNNLAVKYGVDPNSEDMKGMRDFAELAAEANYANVIKANIDAGRTIEEVADSAAYTVNINVNTNNSSDIDSKLDQLNQQIGENNRNIDTANANMNEVERDINNVNNRDSSTATNSAPNNNQNNSQGPNT